MPATQSHIPQSPDRDATKREYLNDYVETLIAVWEFWFDSETRGDYAPRKTPPTAGILAPLR
jgi:hypothetical protein